MRWAIAGVTAMAACVIGVGVGQSASGGFTIDAPDWPAGILPDDAAGACGVRPCVASLELSIGVLPDDVAGVVVTPP